MIYPADDERVLRVIRKIIRGLCYHHRLGSPVPESRVWVDIRRLPIPQYLLDKMEHYHREADVAQYRFDVANDPPVLSAWAITFYEAVTFVGMVLDGTETGTP
jgi:hypothetical protein